MISKDYQFYCWAWMLIALVCHIYLFKYTAAFGRHSSTKWGPMLNARWAWGIMELPSLLLMFYFMIRYLDNQVDFRLLLFACWIGHYTNRALIFPLRIRSTSRQMPWIICISAIVFNVINASLNGYYLAALAVEGTYGVKWLCQWSTLCGMILFLVGSFINVYADHLLLRLRKKGESHYMIPKGFLFEKVSCPNHFGEILEWIGFALMAWNLAAVSFAVWTMANLVPRAVSHHKWYKIHFSNYPSDRKAVIPGIL